MSSDLLSKIVAIVTVTLFVAGVCFMGIGVYAEP